MTELTGYIRSAYVGRGKLLDLSEARLDRAAGGGGGMLLIAGEPGAGKSRFADELASRARTRGWTTISGRCYEAEGSPPYAPVVESIRQITRTLPAERLTDLARQVGPEIGLLIREFQQAPRRTAVAEPDRFRLFECVIDLLTILAGERSPGLFIAFDDLQWADEATLRLLVRLARKLAGQRILVAGSYRSTEADRGTVIATALAELRRERLADTLQMEPLSTDEVGQLVRELAGETSLEFVRTVERETTGNPFFIEELVLHLAATGAIDTPASQWTIPDGLRTVLGQRISRLGTEAVSALEAASVLGDPVDFSTLARLLGWTDERLTKAIDPAVRDGLLRDDAAGYRFSHALIGAALYEDISVPVRRALHLRAADSFENSAKNAAAIARHLFESGQTSLQGRAAAMARGAGEEAFAVLAYEDAARWFDRALAAAEAAGESAATRGDLLERLGTARRQAGQLQQAMAAFWRVSSMNSDDSAALARAALGYEEAYLATGVPRSGANDPSNVLLQRALEGQLEPAMRARVLASLAKALFYSGEFDRASGLSEEALAIARTLDDTAVLGFALGSKRIVIAGPDLLRERLEVSSEIDEIASRVGDEETALEGLYGKIYALFEQARMTEARTAIAEYRRRAEQLRQPRYIGFSHMLAALLLLLEARWEEAEAESHTALRFGELAENSDAWVHWVVQLIPIRLEQSALPEFIAGFLEELGRQRHLPNRRPLFAALLAMAGRLDEAQAEYEPIAKENFSIIPRDHYWLPITSLLSTCATLLPDKRGAEVLYRILSPYSGRLTNNHNTVCYGPVDQFLASLAATYGAYDIAERHFEAAMKMNVEVGAPAHLAKAKEGLARMLLDRRGDGSRARRLLEEAQADYVRLRMDKSANDLGAFLGALRGSRQRVPDGLARREIEVLRLIAGGRTNREIAQELYLSERTIERHITNAYTKIGARGKADATAYVLRHNISGGD